MQKTTLALGIGLFSLGLIAAVPTQAQAKSYAKVTKISRNLVVSDNFVNFTGKNALYSKAGTLKGAKLVKSKAQLTALANSKVSSDSFMYLRTATTNRGSIYVKVRSFNNKITGWIYAGSTKSYKSQYTYYTDAARTKPAGGVTTYYTTKASPLSTDEKTSFYKLKNPGTDTLVTSNIPDTIPDAFQMMVNMPNKTSSAAYANDVFVITRINGAFTRTREGDRWYGIVDLNANTNIMGYVKADALTKIGNVSASDGITINYVDRATNKKVGSTIVPYGTVAGQSSMDLTTTFYNYQGGLKGYNTGFDDDDSNYGFARNSGANAATKGSTLTYYVSKVQ